MRRFAWQLARHRDAASPQRPEDARYPAGQLVAYGTQHILTMYGGVIAPPLIVGGAAGLPAAEMGLLVTSGLFVAGLATLLQTLGMIPIAAPKFWDAFPDKVGVVLNSGISATAIVAVVLNLLFNEWKYGKRTGASVFVAAEDNRDRFGDRIDDDIEP